MYQMIYMHQEQWLLFERRVINRISPSHVFDTLDQIYISCSRKRNDMRVLGEWLEGYRIMHLIICVSVIMKVYQRRRLQRFVRYWVNIFVLSANQSICQLLTTSQCTYLSHGIIEVSSKTCPVPSAFLAQTGVSKGWKVRAHESNGVIERGFNPSAFLSYVSFATAIAYDINWLLEPGTGRMLSSSFSRMLRMSNVQFVAISMSPIIMFSYFNGL